MLMIIMPLLRTDTTTYNTTSINDNYTLILIIFYDSGSNMVIMCSPKSRIIANI